MIGAQLGVLEDLKQCFPNTSTQLASITYYLVLEDKSPLYRFEKWSSSELFASITEEAINAFFRVQGTRRLEQECWAYDITTISSHSACLRQVPYGWNTAQDRLPQLNLALVFGEKTNLPLYYRTLAGTIPDSKTVTHVLAELDLLGYAKVKLVMDRGFYSQDHINALLFILCFT